MKKIYEGTISCKALLENENRQCFKLYVDRKKRNKNFAYIIHLAKARNIEVIITNREELDRIAPSKKHGGMLLEAQTKQFETPKYTVGWSVYIDGLEDPYNLGSVCRTLYAAGCSSLILPKRNWEEVETTILKSSAGAFEKLNIYMIDSEQEFVDYLKTNAIPLYCAYRNKAESIYDTTFPETCCIAIGGAYRGLSKTILDASEKNVYIEYGNDFKNALDTPSACSVFGFEILRQRRKSK